MRTFKLAVVTALLVVAIPGGVNAGGMKTLGTDASADAPSGADLLALSVAQKGSDLQIRIDMNLNPLLGSYPGAGIQWAFASGSKVFVAETHQQQDNSFSFTLYEFRGGALNVLGHIDGEVDIASGAIDMFVPLSKISARKGTRISGVTLSGGAGDVEIHQHVGVGAPIVDSFETTKPFKIK